MQSWKMFAQPPRQGTSHKKRGDIPCQDSAVIMENETCMVAVLTDGVGSLQYSQVAAKVFTEAAAELLMAYDYHAVDCDVLKQDVLNGCRKKLVAVSEERNIPMDQMDATLLFAVMLKEQDALVWGQLGDGAVCVVKRDQAEQMETFQDSFRASANMTKTVLSKNASEYMKVERIPAADVLGVILTSDGLDGEIYSKAGKAKKMIRWYFNLISNQEPEECMEQIRGRWDELTASEEAGFLDDMSLVAIVRNGESIDLPEDANWLCICGHRNQMESSWCEKCMKDITNVYKGVKFREYGGRRQFFSMLNENPEKEWQVLLEHCVYAFETNLEEYPLADQDCYHYMMSGVKEILFKANLDYPAVKLDEIEELNMIGSTPQAIFEVQLGMLRALNSSKGVECLKTPLMREMAYHIYEKYHNFINGRILNRYQWKYLCSVEEEGQVFERQMLEYLGNIDKEEQYHTYLRYLELREVVKEYYTHLPLYPHIKELEYKAEICSMIEWCIEHENALNRILKAKADSYEREYAYESETFKISVPSSVDDFLCEANSQHNCFYRCIFDMAFDHKIELVMRDKRKPDEALVTIEVEDDFIEQAYQACNSPLSEAQRAFLEEYAEQKNLIIMA